MTTLKEDIETVTKLELNLIQLKWDEFRRDLSHSTMVAFSRGEFGSTSVVVGQLVCTHTNSDEDDGSISKASRTANLVVRRNRG